MKFNNKLKKKMFLKNDFSLFIEIQNTRNIFYDLVTTGVSAAGVL